MRNDTKIVISTLTCLLIGTFVFGQSPGAISYQTVIRDASSALVSNTQVGMKISILQTSVNGTAVYTEVHTPTTNVNGLVTVEIGRGTSFDDFTTIDWSMGPYFLKTETDPEGGTDFSLTGVSQLLSVPYALHAKTAETVTNVDITETDPAYTASPAANIIADDIIKLGNLSGTNTGDQDISGIAANTQAIQDTAAQIRADIPDISGFLTAETDPEYTSSPAASITADDITKLGNLSGTNTGNQDISGIAVNTQAIQDTAAQIRADIPDVSRLLTTETDPEYTSSPAASITADDITNLGNLSGTNTGNQDISGIAVNTQAIQDTAAQIRADIPDVSGFLTTETDPEYTSSPAASITADDITKLGNLSGTNTGNQDISGIAVNTQAIQDTAAQIRADIPDVSGFLTTETDPEYTSSPAASITADDITKLGNLSGTNTGNQDISGIAVNTQAIQDTAAQIRADIPDVSGFLTTETDPEYTSSPAASITADDITNLGNLSGTNTGNQDISGIAVNTQAIQDTAAQIRADIPTGTQAGEMQYWDGSAWVTLAPTYEEATLTIVNGLPAWTGGYSPVISTTGRTWLGLNLGATRVAASMSDEDAYGHYYQWGRAADGHESTTGTTTTLSTTDTPGHGDFIVTDYSSLYDWRSPQNDNLWQGVNGINNPCPSGYRLPTIIEWIEEINSWSNQNATGAFNSPLKLVRAGHRNNTDGGFEGKGTEGWYWSRSVKDGRSYYLRFSDGAAQYNITNSRSLGLSVRCIKD